MKPMRELLEQSYHASRRVFIAVVGFGVLLAGVVMLVTPGPAFVVIPLGLGILAVEFAWARRWLQEFKDRALSAADYVQGKPAKSQQDSLPDASSPTSSENEEQQNCG